MTLKDQPPEIQIRLATPLDLPAIASVLYESFIEYKSLYTPEGFSATTPDSERLIVRIKEGPVWIVLIDDELIGTVSAVMKGNSLYVRGMAILPSGRGKRIGELLLDQVEDFAVQQNCKRLFLSTTPFLVRAIQLYEHYGFKRTAEGPDDLFGTPLFTMEKLLKSSEEPV